MNDTTTTAELVIVRLYRGGIIRCYLDTSEYDAEFGGVPIWPTQRSERAAQLLIDDRRLDLIEAGALTPDATDLRNLGAGYELSQAA